MALHKALVEVVSDDETCLCGRVWDAARAAKAIVQIAHGAGEHLGRYEHVAAGLVNAGYAVIGADHRGHGANACDGLGELGPRAFPGVVDDMAAVSRHARRSFPSLPLILFGHSFGSFAAQVYLTSYSALLDGLVLSGTAALEQLFTEPELNASLEACNAAFQPARTPFDWLSRDETQVDAYIADPLCGHDIASSSIATMPLAFVGIRTHPGLRPAVDRQVPIYVISGERDPVVGPGQWLANAVVEGYSAIGFRDVTHKVYPGARHELLNELNRDEVMRNLVGWLDARF